MLIGAIAMAVLAVLAVANPDYAERLRTDATAFRDTVASSHPGPVNAQDPDFTKRLNAAYERALLRAKTTRTYPQYSWALEELAASFDDGHLGIMSDRAIDASYPWSFRWPGFMTEFDGRNHIVSMSEQDGLQTGAQLVRCDGVDADKLAASRIGHFVGRWSLTSRRRSQSATLFLPPDNPWLSPLTRCTFEQGGQRRTITLKWQSIDAARRKDLLARSRERFHAPVGLNQSPDGTAWISLGSFESDAATSDGQALDKLTRQIEAGAGRLRSAPRIVVDLRGNNGGSSAWINRIAVDLWGEPFVHAKRPYGGYAEWRVSDENINRILAYQQKAEPRRGVDPSTYDWTVRTLTGLRQAQQAGKPLWTEPHTARPSARSPVLPNPVKGEVFVLTDYGCASACLDAVDLLTAMGAIQVGQDTSADTNYMEIRDRFLADKAVIWVPMKVYRDRPRGSNIPAVPRYAWNGSMSDTAGLQRWIDSL